MKTKKTTRRHLQASEAAHSCEHSLKTWLDDLNDFSFTYFISLLMIFIFCLPSLTSDTLPTASRWMLCQPCCRRPRARPWARAWRRRRCWRRGRITSDAFGDNDSNVGGCNHRRSEYIQIPYTSGQKKSKSPRRLLLGTEALSTSTARGHFHLSPTQWAGHVSPEASPAIHDDSREHARKILG